MPSEDTDFYKILDIDKNASEDEIKKAFRRFSKKYHPDMQHGKSDAEKKEAEETFKKGQAAYECLSDPEKRKIYDEYGIDGLRGHVQQGGFSGEMGDNLREFMKRHFGFSWGFSDDDEEGFNPFGNPFGRRQSKRRAPPSNLDPEDGQSYRIRMEVDLEDVIFGTEKEFTMDGFDVCPECHGKKCDGYDECPDCHGEGMTQRLQGNMLFQSTCGRCGGSGYFPKNVCKKCNGSGRIQVKRQIKVKIPIGFPSGGTLRIKDAGAAGLNGGKNGSLFIIVNSKKSNEIFERLEPDGLDLGVNLYINPLMGAFGGDTFVITPFGTTSITIPEKTENGTVITLKNLGINKQGNLIVKIIYDMLDIDSLTEEEKEYWKSVLLTSNNPKQYLKNFKKQLLKVTK